MVVALTVAIATGVAIVSRALAAWGFERWDLSRHIRGEGGVVTGAEPFELEGESDTGVLLLHGFGDTPQTLRGLAAHLHARGHGIVAPLLPGHGRTVKEFGSSSSADWLAEVEARLAELRLQYSRVGVVGLSMGGALGVVLAASHPDIRAIVLIAPYLSVPTTVRRLVRWRPLIGRLLPYFPAFGARSIHDVTARAKNLAYGALNVRVLSELVKLVDRAAEAAPRVAIPVLTLQSREDNRIPIAAAQRAFDRIGSRHKELKWLEGCGHVLTVDYRRDDVAAATADFLERWMSSVRVGVSG